MKIAYVTTNYNWNSYSTLRCAYECLINLGIETRLFFEKCDEIYNYDQIWLMSTGLYLNDDEFKKAQGKVVSFGLSEPCDIVPEKYHNCHVYCSNDLITSIILNNYNDSRSISFRLSNFGYKRCYWFPTSADQRYHHKINIPKCYDVIFLGIGEGHPTGRIPVIDELRNNGINIATFGNGWPKHPMNFGRIESDDIITKINQSKIMLDIATENSSLGRRIFEAMSCGTAAITRKRKDVEKMFVENKEIILYSNYSEISDKIKYMLSNQELLDTVSKNGMLACHTRHDMSVRIKELLDYLK
jgi:hypothetical protein